MQKVMRKKTQKSDAENDAKVMRENDAKNDAKK